MGLVMLERTRELDAIDALVADAAAGRGAALVLAGPPGIGKSALLREAVLRGRAEGLRVLSVRLDELDGSAPFGVARDLLASELASVGAATASPLVGRALEALGQPLAEQGDAERDRDNSASSVRHALYWLVAGLADRTPLLLAVDDVHWADVASLRFLGHLARRVDGLPLALVVATRRGEVGVAAEVLAQIGSHDHLLQPQPLTAGAAATIARAAFGELEVPDELCATLHSCTAGNPLALHELLTALRDAGVTPREASPQLVRRLGAGALANRVQQRLDRVSADAVQLARAFAVVGDIGGPEAVGGLVGIPGEKARIAADELVGAELLRVGVECRFVHPLIREAIREGVAPEGRDDLAHRAAALLAGRSDDIAAAGQLLNVTPAGDAWVVEALLRAATISVDRGAQDVAAPLLRRATQEPPPPDRRAEAWAALGSVQLAIGEPGAVASLEEAMRHAADSRTRGLVAQDLAQALIHLVRVGDAADVLGRAAAELRAESATGPDAELADELEMRRLMFGTWDPSLRALVVEHVTRQPDQPARHGAFAQRLNLLIRALDSVASCRPATDGAALVELALADDTLFRRDPNLGLAGPLLLGVCGRPQQARRHLERTIARARAAGALPVLRASIGLRGQISMLEGDVLEAETDGWAMQDLFEEGELGAPYLLGFLTDALLAQGRVDDANATLRQAGLMEGPLPDLGPLNTILWARGRVRAAQGELHAGLEDLLSCGARQESIGQRNPALNPWRAAAVEVLTRLGRYDEAVDLAEEDLELSRRFGAAHVIGAALRSRAHASGGVPDLRPLEEAGALLTPSFARLTLAHVHHDLGVAHVAKGDNKAARESFGRAVGLALQLSATRLAEQATVGLVAAGGRPRRAPTRGAEALTPSERRVADLAVTGAKNREIAQALFVTEKTVETHLRHAFRKLGVGSRAQLAAALGGG